MNRKAIIACLLLCASTAWGTEETPQAVFRVVSAELVSRCSGLPVLLSGAEAEVWVKSELSVNRRERKKVLVCVGTRGDISVQIAQERSVHTGWQVASAEIYQLGATGHKAGSPLHASVWPSDMQKRDWLVPWQFSGTLEVNADKGGDMRERAYRMVGWALNEERVRTADGQAVLISGPLYVGDPVSPEGLEASRVGRAVHAKLLEQRSSASEEIGPANAGRVPPLQSGISVPACLNSAVESLTR
jgi:hypothetical protein